MKVLHIAFHFWEYTFELCKALVENGVDCMLIVGQKDFENYKKMMTMYNLHIRLVSIKHYTMRNPLFILNTLKIIQVANKFAPDLIHVQENTPPYLALALLMLKRKLPILLTVHDPWIHIGEEKNDCLRRRLARRLVRRLSNKIFVHGSKLKKYFESSNIFFRNRVFTIPHGVLDIYKLPSHQYVKEEDNTILFFGRMWKYKGLEYLIKAVEILKFKLNGFKAIIAGQGPDLDFWINYIKNKDYFEIHDRYIPFEEVGIFFRRATVVVLPYIDATQSGVVAVAYAFLKPVIVTDVGSVSEMVKNGKTGILVPPRDEDALAKAIYLLFTQKDLLREIRQNIEKEVRYTYSWQVIASKLINIYKETLR